MKCTFFSSLLMYISVTFISVLFFVLVQTGDDVGYSQLVVGKQRDMAPVLAAAYSHYDGGTAGFPRGLSYFDLASGGFGEGG